jgi:lipopolysaccharide transport system permease protein
LWAIVHPLILMVIFTFFFGPLVKLEGIAVAYPVFVFAGLIPWTLFSQGFSQAALSLISQQNLLTKVYFPRLFVPIASASEWWGSSSRGTTNQPVGRRIYWLVEAEPTAM